MTQTFLGAPSGKPVRAKPRDPYTAENADEFMKLFFAAEKRRPSGPETLAYYEAHPEQFQDKFNEPWSAVEAREKKYGLSNRTPKGVR